MNRAHKFIFLVFFCSIFSLFNIQNLYATETAPITVPESSAFNKCSAKDGKFCLNVPIPGTSGEMEISSALGNYIKAWYSFIIGGIGIIATVMIMVAGFKWLTSGGNSSKTGDAKDMIVSAIIGLVLAFLSYTVLYLINPNLTIIHLPDLKSKSVNIAEPQYRDTDPTNSGNTPIDTTTQNNNAQLLRANGILIKEGIRVDGLTSETIQAVIALRQAYGHAIVITSGYRPRSTGSQHALGLAFDVRRTDHFDNWASNLLARETADFNYHGQEGYNDVQIGGINFTVIDEPVNNCWHFDIRDN